MLRFLRLSLVPWRAVAFDRKVDSRSFLHSKACAMYCTDNRSVACGWTDANYGPCGNAGADGTGAGHDGWHVARSAERPICTGAVEIVFLFFFSYLAVCVSGPALTFIARPRCYSSGRRFPQLNNLLLLIRLSV